MRAAANQGVKIGGFCSLFSLLKGVRGVLIPQMSAGRAPVVPVGNSAAYLYVGYSQLPLGGKPPGAQKAPPSAGPETARNAVVRRQASSRTPLILSEVITDAPGSGARVMLRFESAASLCEIEQPQGGPFLNALKLPPTDPRGLGRSGLKRPPSTQPPPGGP